MAHLLELHCPDQASDVPRRCEVDLDTVPEGWGGFGTVYPVVSNPGYVVKRIAMENPQPLGNVGSYTVHVTETRTRFEEILSRGAGAFPREMIREILASLALAWSVDRAPDGRMAALWFLQRRAPGRSLREFFKEPAPSIPVRENIAKAVVARMRALRRADLVHLDCVDDNIFLDLTPGDGIRVTLIDLDGCGIVKRSFAPTSPSDRWLHKPFTLGHLSTTWVPPWYPQPNVDAGPRSGNYLYGERWVVLDTIIRILTWNRLDSLSWLDPSASLALTSGYATVTDTLAKIRSSAAQIDVPTWKLVWSGVVHELSSTIASSPVFGDDPESPRAGVFVRLAQRAFFDPAELSSHRLAGNNQESPYGTFDQWLG